MPFSPVKAEFQGYVLAYTGDKYVVPVALHFAEAGVGEKLYLGAIDNISPYADSEGDFHLKVFSSESEANRFKNDLVQKPLKELWAQVVEPTEPSYFQDLEVVPFMLSRTIG